MTKWKAIQNTSITDDYPARMPEIDMGFTSPWNRVVTSANHRIPDGACNLPSMRACESVISAALKAGFFKERTAGREAARREPAQPSTPGPQCVVRNPDHENRADRQQRKELVGAQYSLRQVNGRVDHHKQYPNQHQHDRQAMKARHLPTLGRVLRVVKHVGLVVLVQFAIAALKAYSLRFVIPKSVSEPASSPGPPARAGFLRAMG